MRILRGLKRVAEHVLEGQEDWDRDKNGFLADVEEVAGHVLEG